MSRELNFVIDSQNDQTKNLTQKRVFENQNSRQPPTPTRGPVSIRAKGGWGIF